MLHFQRYIQKDAVKSNNQQCNMTVTNSRAICLFKTVSLNEPPFHPAGGTIQALMHLLGEGERLRDESVTVTIISLSDWALVCSVLVY